MDKIFEITAKEVTIQVKDERTGEQVAVQDAQTETEAETATAAEHEVPAGGG